MGTITWRMEFRKYFSEKSYEQVKQALTGIKPPDDIYAISFWKDNIDDDLRKPLIQVGFNTLSQVAATHNQQCTELEAKWNFAYWLQNELTVIGGEDENLTRWLQQTPYYYSDEEEEDAIANDDLFESTQSKGNAFQQMFMEEIINITHKLKEQQIFTTCLGKEVPVIIHELEYYELPVSWTQSANPPELIAGFLSWYHHCCK